MNWWGWVIGGAILLGAELTWVNAQFYLVFVGCAALLVGVATSLIPSIPVTLQWVIFGALAVVSMVGFRSKIYDRLRGHAAAVRSGPVGDVLTVPVALVPGQSCQTEHSGTYWTVRNDSDTAIASGGRARVVGVQGLTLTVRPEPPE